MAEPCSPMATEQTESADEVMAEQPPPAKDTQRQNWGITINNYTAEDEAQFNRPDLFRYAVAGREVGEEGTPHLQGMVVCKRSQRFSYMKTIFPRANIKPVDLNYAKYCKKDNDFIEYGAITRGNKTNLKIRWDRAKSLAIEGKFMEIEPSLYIRYYNNFHSLYHEHHSCPPCVDELTHEWHYGSTGGYKSFNVHEQYPNAFFKGPDEWWGGYKNEEVVVIEELDKYHVKLGYHLKVWADHYPFPAGFKHQSQRMIRPKKIIVTSNYSICEIWDDPKTTLPLSRRFTLFDYDNRVIIPPTSNNTRTRWNPYEQLNQNKNTNIPQAGNN